MIYYCLWHVVCVFSLWCFYHFFVVFFLSCIFWTRMVHFRCVIWIKFRSKCKITRKEQTKPTYCVQICKHKRNHPNYDSLLGWFGCVSYNRPFVYSKKNKIQFQVFAEFKRRPTTDLSLTHSVFCRHAVRYTWTTARKKSSDFLVCFYRRYILYLVHLLNSNEMSGSTEFKLWPKLYCSHKPHQRSMDGLLCFGLDWIGCLCIVLQNMPTSCEVSRYLIELINSNVIM